MTPSAIEAVPALGGGGGGAVTTVAGRTGDVVLAVADVSGAAPAASPTFTGTVTLPSGLVLPAGVTVPDQTAGDNSGKAANTKYVDTGLALKAPASGIAESAVTGLVADLAAKLALAGGTMSGPIAMGTNKVTGAGDPSAAQDVMTKAYADAHYNVLTSRIPMPTGQWWTPEIWANSTLLLTQAKLFATPIDISQDVSATAIGVEITTAGASGALVRLGFYAVDATTGKPGSLILDAGTINGTVAFATTPGAVTGLTQALSSGRIFLACVGQGSPATQATVRCISVAGSSRLIPNTAQPSNTGQVGFAESGTATSGALPGTFPACALTGNAPKTVFKT